MNSFENAEQKINEEAVIEKLAQAIDLEWEESEKIRKESYEKSKKLAEEAENKKESDEYADLWKNSLEEKRKYMEAEEKSRALSYEKRGAYDAIRIFEKEKNVLENDVKELMIGIDRLEKEIVDYENISSSMPDLNLLRSEYEKKINNSELRLKSALEKINIVEQGASPEQILQEYREKLDELKNEINIKKKFVEKTRETTIFEKNIDKAEKDVSDLEEKKDKMEILLLNAENEYRVHKKDIESYQRVLNEKIKNADFSNEKSNLMKKDAIDSKERILIEIEQKKKDLDKINSDVMRKRAILKINDRYTKE